MFLWGLPYDPHVHRCQAPPVAEQPPLAPRLAEPSPVVPWQSLGVGQLGDPAELAGDSMDFFSIYFMELPEDFFDGTSEKGWRKKK